MKFPYHWFQPEPFPNYDNHIFGTLDIRVFLQDELWVDVEGKAHLLEEMPEEYLFNVLQHVFQSGEYFYSVMLQWYATALMVVVVMEALGEDPEHIQAFMEDFQKFSGHETPHAWLKSTPLVQKLDYLLEQKENVSKEEN